MFVTKLHIAMLAKELLQCVNLEKVISSECLSFYSQQLWQSSLNMNLMMVNYTHPRRNWEPQSGSCRPEPPRRLAAVSRAGLMDHASLLNAY